VKRAGARKILFGSDGPWLHPGVEIHKIRLLGLPREQENLILGGNASRLLRTVRPYPASQDAHDLNPFRSGRNGQRGNERPVNYSYHSSTGAAPQIEHEL
jgi:hypothetical protein